ncbi:MAG: glycosyltransferase [Deltaproteobacteria bacterium]|nr:glycosyltransferase [Deltaproteobacteria bacterium]
MRGLLVYPISVDHPGNRGILNKMEYQWAAFSELTGDVDLVCSSNRGPILNGELASKYPITGRAFNSLNHYALFYSHIAKYAQSGDYDYLYIRYPLALPNFLWFLRKTKQANPKTKVVVEIATFPYRRELRTPKRLVLRTLDDLGHGQLKNHVDAIVTFYGQSEIFGVPCLQLRNGVDVERIHLRNATPSDDGLVMIAVGNVAERHGLDRMLRGMANYEKQSGAARTTLHVVGDGPAVGDLKILAGQLSIDRHVRFHGLKSGAELDAVFDQANIALDSLGIHRLQLPCSSSLKAREYCARGIPFVLSSDDLDFPSELGFVHRVPADDRPVDVSALVAFHTEVTRTTPTVHREMRRYAEEHLTWKSKLEPLVHYLQANTDRRAP